MVTRHGDSGVGTLSPLHRGSGSAAGELQSLLAAAGLRLNGTRPRDPRIHDERAIAEILRRGTLGAGEAYMRGWWDAPALDECLAQVMRAGLEHKLRSWRATALILKAWLVNPQSRSRAFRVGEVHYDLDNDLFAAMLDRRMVYSCAYWDGAATLDEAQANKLDLVCRKLGLARGQRLLDIGCGWGSLCRFAARRYGAEVVGITVSKRQAGLARERCRGLPVEIRLQDYRDVDERFDRVASIGMFEHVGARNYRKLMRVVRRCLDPDGLFLLHTIGNNVTERAVDPWIDRYIFPNGHLPSLQEIATAAESSFVVEDLHNFGSHYDRTLSAWYRNFDAAWPRLQSRFDTTFYRMWKYYLLSCAAAFRVRSLQVWQLLLSPAGVPGGYRRPPA